MLKEQYIFREMLINILSNVIELLFKKKKHKIGTIWNVLIGTGFGILAHHHAYLKYHKLKLDIGTLM